MTRRRRRLMGTPIDPLSRTDVLEQLRARAPGEAFTYVVTPNVDHVVRLNRDDFRHARLYERAWLSTCDSRILAGLARLTGTSLPVVAGCDVVQDLLDHVISPDEPVTIIGCEDEVISALRRRYGLSRIAHHYPPFGFMNRPKQVDAAVDFVLANPSRFVFLAVGSPRQELLADRIAATGQAVGTGLCVGVALHVAAGVRSRGPVWARRLGLEWAARLAQEPGRLWRRYLIDGPSVFVYFARHHVLPRGRGASAGGNGGERDD